MTVNHFAQFLLKKGPRQNPVRLAAYHFFKNFFELDRPLGTDLLNAFYRQCLQFNYWQAEKSKLNELSLADLYEFSHHFELDLGLDQFTPVTEWQVITPESEEIFVQCLNRQLSKGSQSQQRKHIINFSSSESLCLQLFENGNLRVQVFPHLLCLKDGQVSPLGPRTSLEYNSFMDLSSKCDQLLHTGAMDMVRFRAEGNYLQGIITSGHTFNKRELLDGHLSDFPALFFRLKSLEKHFIRPQSDPYYHEVVALLEKAVRTSQEQVPGHRDMARKALKQGQLALKGLFPEDKLIHLLCTRLEAKVLEPSQFT